MLEKYKMKKTFVSMPIIVSKFEKHYALKDELLKLIEQEKNIGSQSILDTTQSISLTDWKKPSSSYRPYWNYLKPHLDEHVIKVYSELQYNSLTYDNYWFQQYVTNDFHDWHVHGVTNWTNIYYVELPNNEVKTEVISPENYSVFVPEVEEGCILTMPAMLKHRSPKNTTTGRKTVVVFNISSEYIT